MDVPRVCNGIELSTVQTIYYLAIVAVLLFAFAAWRLRESRLGRAWMAIREDEDVAEALESIDSINFSRLYAGCRFLQAGSAIFATLIGSIFASSMQLIVSINVVALIVVGGMGSIPGVIVGAIFLIGIPGLLREVSEFRYLFYGAALILMMILKPEGLWPSGYRTSCITRMLKMSQRKAWFRGNYGPILTTSEVTKRFGGLTAVSRVDFVIPEKSIVSIIGRTALAKQHSSTALPGFGKADEGSITFEGTEIRKLRPDQIARLGISRTYQNIRLFADMTALENILVGQHEFLPPPG